MSKPNSPPRKGRLASAASMVALPPSLSSMAPPSSKATSPTATTMAPPPLLRCTSTPVVPAFFDLGDLLDGEALFSFSDRSGHRANDSASPVSFLSRRSSSSMERSSIGDEGRSTSPRPMSQTQSLSAEASPWLRRSPRGHKTVGGNAPRTKGRLSIESDDDSGVHSMSLAMADDTADKEATNACVTTQESFATAKGAVPKRYSQRLVALTRQRDICSAPEIGGSLVNGDAAAVTADQPLDPVGRMTYLPGHFLQREHVDFVHHLCSMSAAHILCGIYACLSPRDLCAVSLVSSTWRKSISWSQDASLRRKEFVKECKRNRVSKISSSNGVLNGSCRRLVSFAKIIGNVSFSIQQENLNALSSSYFGSPRKAMANRSNMLPTSPGQRAKRERDTANRKSLASPSKIRHRLFTAVSPYFSLYERCTRLILVHVVHRYVHVVCTCT
jgi:hypothetical protein